MIVLVTGGRKYNDLSFLSEKLWEVHNYTGPIDAPPGISLVIHGDAPGADTLADRWATANGIQNVRCPANWEHYKNAAGPVRNKAMLGLRPDLIVAFDGGNGTKNMKDTAKKLGYKVWDTTTGESLLDYLKPFYVFDDGY